jgi:hypothetical protein
MLLTVNKYLNIRIGSPSTSASCPGYLEPGDNIDLDTIVAGDELDGNAIWYKSKKGYYYWSGGITETAFEWTGIVLTPALKDAILYDILHNYCNEYRKQIDGYLGCGPATNETGSPAIRILIDRNSTGAGVPEFIIHKGTRLNIITERISVPKLHGFGPGDLISGAYENGTIAVSVEFDNRTFLLGSYHVMASHELENGQTVLNENNNLWVTMKNGNNSCKLKVFKGGFSELFDYALAILPDNINWENRYENISISGTYTELETEIAVGDFVQSLGAVTQSRAQVLDALYDITLAGYSFKQVIRTQRLSVPGDSGAVVYGGDDNKVIGIVLGGDEDGYSYLVPAYQLVNENITFK